MLSLFLADLPGELIGIDLVIKGARYSSYLLFGYNLMDKKFTLKNFRSISMLFIFCLVITLMTKDIYYPAIVMIIASMMSNRNIRDLEIIRISYCFLLISMFAVIFLVISGIIPNTYNIKDGVLYRYSLGYYHSNVFPMILFFLYSWRMIIKDKINDIEALFTTLISFIVYKLCYSRVALLSVLLLTIYILFQNHIKSKKIRKAIEKLLCFFEKKSILILSVFSMALTLIAGNGYYWVYKLNKLISGRFALGYLKMKEIGLHIINTMSGSEYEKGDFVIDNGYIYIMLRYGLIFILFYIVLQTMICKKSNNKLAFVFLITTIASSIDNDLFSYGFFPYIIIAFSGKEPMVDNIKTYISKNANKYAVIIMKKGENTNDK